MLLKKYLKPYKNNSKTRSLPFYLIENFKVLKEIINSNSAKICALFLSEDFALREQTFFQQNRHIPQLILKTKELKRYSALSTNEQIIGVIAKIPPENYAGHKGLAVVLENIQNPNNLGAIIRNAKWFGVQHIFCSPNSVSLYNPKTLQASMGAHIGINIYYQPLLPFLQNMRAQNSTIIASSVQSLYSNTHEIPQLSAPNFLIMGNESHGISADLCALATHFVHIPPLQNTDSLNVAVANGIVLQQLLGAPLCLHQV